MKVGDLVKVPECISGTPSYIGLVTGVTGTSVFILGGAHIGVESWDGTPGVDTWHRADLKLIKHEKSEQTLES